MNVAIKTARAREGLQLLHAGFLQAAAMAMRAGVQATEQSAKGTALWKDKSGGTRGSIRGEVFGASRGLVSAGGASGFLENGTRPHAIFGHPMLRFEINGQIFFRRMVRHPGTKGTHFMSEARDRGEQALSYGAEYYVGEAIRRVH